MWRQQKQSMTDTQTDGQTDNWQSDHYVVLCFTGTTKKKFQNQESPLKHVYMRI